LTVARLARTSAMAFPLLLRLLQGVPLRLSPALPLGGSTSM
jgi:hypothetical protein